MKRSMHVEEDPMEFLYSAIRSGPKHDIVDVVFACPRLNLSFASTRNVDATEESTVLYLLFAGVFILKFWGFGERRRICMVYELAQQVACIFYLRVIYCFNFSTVRGLYRSLNVLDTLLTPTNRITHLTRKV